jgi:hypothetical protein
MTNKYNYILYVIFYVCRFDYLMTLKIKCRKAVCWTSTHCYILVSFMSTLSKAYFTSQWMAAVMDVDDLDVSMA